jgi:cation transport protein ChaC
LFLFARTVRRFKDETGSICSRAYYRPSENRAGSQREESTQLKTKGIRPEDAKDAGHLWVFGYGSLMWRPGFEFLERVPARLIGLHRALCVYSFVHRGTPERPGLVLGLDRGGICRGIAFRVAAAARAETVAYLRGREQVTTVYVETLRRIELKEPARRQVRALCFIVDRSHVQYAGRLTLSECVHHVRQGHGRSGANRDYVIESVQALEALGYRETDLHLIAARLKSESVPRKSEVSHHKLEAADAR